MELAEWVYSGREEYEDRWRRYLEYLKTWADDHADPAYAGMTPACFDEWLENEYAEEEEE